MKRLVAENMLRSRVVSVLAMGILCLGFAMRPASAVSYISGTLTADNAFWLYLSTSDSTRGTLIASGNDWTTAKTLSPVQALTRGTNYLHLVLVNYGGPYAFLGTFNLNGNATGSTAVGASFSNGSTTLSTNTTNWKTRFVGNYSGSQTPTEPTNTWVAPTSTPSLTTTGGTSPYNKGVGPWTPLSNATGIASTALWIGDPNTDYSTVNNGNFIVAYSTSFVPEPAGLGVLGAALFALTWARRRRVPFNP